jgi:hypothetical protein
MRHAAQQVAARGRFGDTMLLHVSPAELEGIASLIPGGLTTNPQTGLPEAFFFLPFLASLFGAAAPAAAAATAAAPALAAGAGAAAAGAGTAAALGAPAAAMTAGTLASAAAPAITTGLGTVTGGLGGLMKGVGAIGKGIGSLFGAGQAPAAQVAGNAIRHVGGAGSAAANFAPAAGSFAAMHPPITAATMAPAAQTAVKTAVTPPAKGGIRGLFTMKNLPLLAVGAQGLSNMVGGLFQKKEKGEKSRDISKIKYSGGDASFPERAESAAYREHNYFPNYQYAQGGIVTLADGGMVDPQMQQPQDLSFPMAGVPAGGTDEAPALEDIPSSPYPTSQIGTEPEPTGETAEPTTDNDRELIAQTVEVIQGKIPPQDAQPIILSFVQEFGEPALQDLAARVKAMPKSEGRSDGMSDSIPAMIDGKQPAALSEGEYVVPADVVSGMGNGSTQAGAQALDGMVGDVRTARTGSPQQPPQMNTGGLVSSYAQGGIVGLKKGGKVRVEEVPVILNYGEQRLQEQMEPRDVIWGEPDLINRSRLQGIFRDYNIPAQAIPGTGYTEEWAKGQGAYQRAMRELARGR